VFLFLFKDGSCREKGELLKGTFEKENGNLNLMSKSAIIFFKGTYKYLSIFSTRTIFEKKPEHTTNLKGSHCSLGVLSERGKILLILKSRVRDPAQEKYLSLGNEDFSTNKWLGCR
jgi:hypothetical protein